MRLWSNWSGRLPRAARLVIAALAVVLLWPPEAYGLRERHLTSGGGTIPVAAARFPLSRYRIGVALAGSRVGANAFLLDIARMARAHCAINGTFFAAYPGETGEPYGTLVVGGTLLHLGAIGTRLDVLADGTVQMVRDRLEIRGSLDGSDVYPHNWYAYNLNQTPSPGGSSVYIFTPERGATLGFRAELAVVALHGIVIRIARGEDVPIPGDGFVVAMQRKEVEILGWKFRVGQRIGYRAMQDGVPFESRFSLGAGPRLVERGSVAVSPIAEGFRDPKIVSWRGTRSVVGLTAEREVILAVIGRATVAEAAMAIKGMGAVEAMNLDDNASSGLVCGGKYLVQPGRQVANALVVWPSSLPR
jgi:Phosphodiester glycosidase